MIFIVVLLMTLGAAYGYEHTATTCAEIAIAFLALVLIFASLTLLTAPWPIHLVMLLVLLHKTSHLTPRSNFQK